MTLSILLLLACGGPAPTEAPPPAAKVVPSGPLPALILTQARFEKVGSKTVPRPATLSLFRFDGTTWHESSIEDDTSNVFHKGMWWRDGILTIGAMKARLTHWTEKDGTWTPRVLWERSWGGKFDRLRDLEIADVTGDGKENLVIATHDMGVVAVGTEGPDGTWAFAEFGEKPDTFVHEIELGDLDGSGKKAIYSTPSDRNRSSGASQQGGVHEHVFVDGKWVTNLVVHWEDSHAKEILVADTDGDGRDELYAVREAEVVVEGTQKKALTPVRIVRLDRSGETWTETVVAELDDLMSRFLISADIDHDGALELLASGKTSGLHRLERQPDGTFTDRPFAKDSSGFEHAIHTADLDGDGKVEIYVASDEQGELRRYVWLDGGFEATVIGRIPSRALTWGIQDGRF